MRTTPFIGLILLLVSSCGAPDKEEEVRVDRVKVEGKYSLAIPTMLSEAKDLNQEASLQYGDELKELYVIVLDEPEEEFYKALEENDLTMKYGKDLEGYVGLLTDSFTRNIQDAEQGDVQDTTVNGMPTKIVPLMGVVEGQDIFYKVAYLEGEEQYYQVMTWTLQSRKEEHKRRMEKMLHSLKELD